MRSDLQQAEKDYAKAQTALKTRATCTGYGRNLAKMKTALDQAQRAGPAAPGSGTRPSRRSAVAVRIGPQRRSRPRPARSRDARDWQANLV